MSGQRVKRSGPLSRRKFVSLLAAGSAAALARPADAVAAVPTRSRSKSAAGPAAKPAGPPPGPAPRVGPASAEQKEFDRQRANTLAALKAIREYVLPPGGDLPVVFRPLPSPRRGPRWAR